MKKSLMFILMSCCLVAMAQAFSVTNGDFELGAGGGSVEAVDEWYDDTSTNFWESAWQSDVAAITPNGTVVVVFCSWNTVEGEPLTGSYIYQEIGTATGSSSISVGFDWGHPDDVGEGRHDGLTVAVYASDGTFIPEDGVDINGADGVTLLDSASYDHVAEGTDGEIFPVLVTLDISGANVGDQIFLRFNNYLPEAGADPWPVLDNVVIKDIVYDSPADGAELIPVERTDAENDLVFTVFSESIADVEVYLSENDPNNLDLIKTINSVGTGQQTITLETELENDLVFNTDYYWQVIGYEPNAVSGQNDIPVIGPVWTFKTAPDAPFISLNPPAYTAVDAGVPSIVLTANGKNGNLQWYKDGSPLSDGADFDGTTTGTLTIYDVQLPDEGNYTLKASSLVGDAESTPARVMIHRQTSYYNFDGITTVETDSVFADSIDGYHAVLMQDSEAAGFPTAMPDTDENAIPGLGGFVYINNEDNAEDPNSQYLQIYPGVSEYEDITITFWAQATDDGAWTRLLDFGNGEASYMFITPDIGSGYDPRFAIGAVGSEQVLTPNLDSSNWIGPGTGWHFIAVTISGDTGKMYIDGLWYVTNAAMTTDPIDIDDALNFIGKSQFAADPYFTGYIDDLKVYNYARTNQQIAEDYMAVTGDAYVCDAENNDVANYDNVEYGGNGNCKIDLPDFAAMAARWLETDQFINPIP